MCYPEVFNKFIGQKHMIPVNKQVFKHFTIQLRHVEKLE